MSESVFGMDSASAREGIEGWAAGLEAKAERYQQMQQRVSEVSATSRSRDGLVRVTVDSGGNVTDLTISDDVRRRSGDEVATAVMSTIRRAQAGITEQVSSVMSETVGDDEATVNAVVSSYRQRFPDPDADEDADHDEQPPPDDDNGTTYLR